MAVHPRGCGEHTGHLSHRLSCCGSSPRVRGTPPGGGGFRINRRFIPAGAGNTAASWRDPCSSSVHPRGCGEHKVTSQYWVLTVGSSPRVRGTLHLFLLIHCTLRFIPAGAGNTSKSLLHLENYTVHPRGCGEHSGVLAKRHAQLGSSPRVRGTPLQYKVN